MVLWGSWTFSSQDKMIYNTEKKHTRSVLCKLLYVSFSLFDSNECSKIFSIVGLCFLGWCYGFFFFFLFWLVCLCFLCCCSMLFWVSALVCVEFSFLGCCIFWFLGCCIFWLLHSVISSYVEGTRVSTTWVPRGLKFSTSAMH